jgi:Carboxypeptidase regulatory-like domain
LGFACFAAVAHAQDPRGAITGQVLDASSAVIPDVSARCHECRHQRRHSAVSNAQSAYEIPYLLPGIYKVDAQLKGFKAWTLPGVELRAGDRIRLDVSLAPGDVKEVVEIKAQGLVLESTTAPISPISRSPASASAPT